MENKGGLEINLGSHANLSSWMVAHLAIIRVSTGPKRIYDVCQANGIPF